MRRLWLGRIGLSAGLLFSGSVALAEPWNRKTYLTFAEPVEVPGAVLPPGQYVFELADTPGNPRVVRILAADSKQVQAAASTISSYRVRVASETVLTFYEMPAGHPRALKSWYYPADSYGQHFAYPKRRAMEIARLTGQHVPIAPENLANAEMLASPERVAKAAANAASSLPTQDAAQTAGPVPAQPRSAVGRTTDRTRDLPLAGLIGATTVLAAAGLRVLTKRFVTKRFV